MERNFSIVTIFSNVRTTSRGVAKFPLKNCLSFVSKGKHTEIDLRYNKPLALTGCQVLVHTRSQFLLISISHGLNRNMES